MILKFRWQAIVPSVVALIAVLALAPDAAQAQVVKPFKISGSGIGPEGLPGPGDTRPHWIEGTATHLGRHHGSGEVHTITLEGNIGVGEPLTGKFGSGENFVFVGANGDKLVCRYGKQSEDDPTEGHFTLTPAPELGPLGYWALWVAEFIPVPDECTGKFAGVTGGWIMYAQSEPFVLGSTDPAFYSWEGEGTLTFRKGK